MSFRGIKGGYSIRPLMFLFGALAALLPGRETLKRHILRPARTYLD
jgi:hypothetical protein